jgi:cytochrome c oxidase assembly protein subunit 15
MTSSATKSPLSLLIRLTTAALLLACIVVSLGAFTRLVHAGLGCPDWPGCYGHLTWPTSADDIAVAEAKFPEFPVEADKTWPEMVHRYAAGCLGLLVLAIAIQTIRHRKIHPKLPVKHALVVCGVIVVQAAFGMWTVTLKLWPQVVTAHLLGGFTTLALIWLLRLRLIARAKAQEAITPTLSTGAGRGLIAVTAVVVLQIALGGWTSANYAAMPCLDFPTCQGSFWPEMDFQHGFNIAQHIGPNYLGGQLNGPGRTAIHVSHRIGALVTTVAVIALIIALARLPGLARYNRAIGGLLALQVSLGISNVVFNLPLAVAVAHNGVAALLLLALVATGYQLRFTPVSNTTGAHKAQKSLQGGHHEPTAISSH